MRLGAPCPRASSPRDGTDDATLYWPRAPSSTRSSLRCSARPNDLAFSCEAANAVNECSQDAARLRLLQRLVRPSATTEGQRAQIHRCFACATSFQRDAQARGDHHEESIVISLPQHWHAEDRCRRVARGACFHSCARCSITRAPARTLPSRTEPARRNSSSTPHSTRAPFQHSFCR